MKSFSKLLAENFEKDQEEFRKATEGLRRVPKRRLQFPIR